MKKGSRFLIGLASAGLTFGILFATLGSGEFNKHGKHCYVHHAQHMQECTK